MSQYIYYEKLTIPCTARQFTAFMQTIQRDYEGQWPIDIQKSLEICSVDTIRFDDPALYAGWVFYIRSHADFNTGLTIDLNYASATIECYDLPLQKISLYFTDGQEPGNDATQCIGQPFIDFVDFIKAHMGALQVASPPVEGLRQHPVLTDPLDLLIVKWLVASPPVSLPLIARRLALSPGSVRAHRKRLRTIGYDI